MVPIPAPVESYHVDKMGGMSSVRHYRIPWSRLIPIALAGCLLGFGLEMVHRAAGVWVLDRPALGLLWIAPIYFLGIVAVVDLLGRFGHLGRPISVATVITEATILGLLFASPPIFYQFELLFAVLILCYLVLRLALFAAPRDVWVALTVVGLDLVIEGVLLVLGVFHYANADFAPVPLWLAPLWGAAALGLRRCCMALSTVTPQ